MSTLVSQPVPQPSWKEEVNRRLEAHKSRRGLALAPNSSPENQPSVSDRAATAAARVAARYAKVPSFSEMQAAEARAALRTAEAATRVALEAQAAAQAVLAQFESEPDDSFEFDSTSAHQPHPVAAEMQSDSSVAICTEEPDTYPAPDSFAIRWDAELPAPRTDLAASHAHLGASDPFADNTLTAPEPPDFVDPSYEVIEAAQPIPANLIHFPREIVATRRMRPRISGLPHNVGEDQYGQLSIFEVDPSSVSTEPVAAIADAAYPAPEISGPEWSGIRLDAEPEPAVERHTAPAAATSNIHIAPFELRVMAMAVDAALTLATFCVGAFGIARHLEHTIALRTAEVSGVVCFFLVALLYQAFFLMTAHSTPGMRYAGISLCTFNGEIPTRLQMRDRLIALLISIAPVGLGLAWAIFDDDHLSWHDRFSRTYKRRS